MKSANFQYDRLLSTAHFSFSVLVLACLVVVLSGDPLGKLPAVGSPLRSAGILLLAATVVYLGATSVAELAVGLAWRRDAGSATRSLLRGVAHGIVLFALGAVAIRGTESRVFAIGQEALLPPLFMTSGVATALAWYGRFIAPAKKAPAGRESGARSDQPFRRILIACSAVAGVAVAACLANVEVQTVPQPGAEVGQAFQPDSMVSGTFGVRVSGWKT